MPMRFIHPQVKLAAMNLFERDILPLSDILDIVGFSESTFWRTRKLWRETGYVSKPKSETSGRRRLLHREDIDYILRRVNLRPDWFLDELLTLLKHNRYISVHFTTIFRELRRLGVSRKKLKKIAAERNELVRMDFVRRMGEYPADYLGFLDETSKNERTLSRGYGRSSMKRDGYLAFIEHEVPMLSSDALDAAYLAFSCPVVCPHHGQHAHPSRGRDTTPCRALR
ncbi:hypothetical protein C8R47DRAFT_1180960 [Mycena vitilis]|nr:hypothetical protein C8R47DRAFT_1180960 [Mycena vitilis]